MCDICKAIGVDCNKEYSPYSKVCSNCLVDRVVSLEKVDEKLKKAIMGYGDCPSGFGIEVSCPADVQCEKDAYSACWSMAFEKVKEDI